MDTARSDPARQQLDDFLQFVRDARGFDFTGYKSSTVERRVALRMNDVGVTTYDEYIDYLELHGDEYEALFNSILINVTGFFRDGPAWDYLVADLLPGLIEGRPPGAPLRVWSAGCASGEEAYSLAMVLARVLGDEEFVDRVKIYATDIDEKALEQARYATYAPGQLQDVPQEALEQFFERTDQRYVFSKDLRRCVIFGRNDLIQDAPISRIDLLVCRNTLMYFTADVQRQILRRFHFALADHGYLMLGRSEMLTGRSQLFTPVDLKRRVFRRVERAPSRHREHRITSAATSPPPAITGDGLTEAAFETAPTAQVILDAESTLVMANDRARRMFAITGRDSGRPIQDLEVSYRPVELRSHLDAVIAELRSIAVRGVRLRQDGTERSFDVQLTPILSDGILTGTAVTYEDVTEARQLREELSRSKRDLETAAEELQATVEELETTNEELQATNEELETTNEELQSANEELETTNEELQSANEELETMNEELRHRTAQLGDTNTFLETILSRIGSAVVVLDRQQHVQTWNAQAHELWGLSAAEVDGKNLFSLDFGLPIERLRAELLAVLSGSTDHALASLPAMNRRGGALTCRVSLYPLVGDHDAKPSGVIMMMESTGD